jgi:hypothetical protein
MEPADNSLTEHESLSALRDYVSKAVDEIVRLRAQNSALARRLSQLELAEGGGGLDLGEVGDPEELRATISGFIDSIDRYLAAEFEDDEDGEDHQEY